MDKVKGILGIDVGDFDLRLDQPSYRLGDTICGTFEFVLKKPRAGSRVWAAVKAIRTTKYTEKNEEGRTQTHTEEDEIFADERHLDGQREYSEGRYEFAFRLPEHLEGFSLGGVDAALDRLDGKYRGLAQGAWSLIQSKVAPDAPKSDQIVWTVSAGVNFPWAISSKKSVRINVGRNLHPSAPEPERNRDTSPAPSPPVREGGGRRALRAPRLLRRGPCAGAAGLCPRGLRRSFATVAGQRCSGLAPAGSGWRRRTSSARRAGHERVRRWWAGLAGFGVGLGSRRCKRCCRGSPFRG